MAQLSPIARLGGVAIVLGLLIVGAGCQWLLTATQLASQPPRMTCPTPTPLPTIMVEDGEEPVLIDGTPTSRPRMRGTAPYEREYGLPLRTPTPYIREAATFPMDTIVNLGAGVDVQLSVAPRAVTRQRGDRTERLYRISAVWHNPGPPFAFDPYRQLVITQVQEADGRLRSSVWRWSPEVAAISDGPMPATLMQTVMQVPSGRSTMHVDVFAPDGQVHVAEVRLDAAFDAGVGGVYDDLRVQFVAGVHDPRCETNGLAAPAPDPARQPAQPVIGGGSADPIVQTALAQVGRQYCWGGKGFAPCSGGGVTPPCRAYPCFDCSGLTWYAYQAHGITIGHGTSNQQLLPRVAREHVRPGDLLLFTGGPVGSTGFTGIRHVGLYVGDVDGDGTGDMVHAANYPDGVVLTPNVFGNRYYQQRLALITRPPR